MDLQSTNLNTNLSLDSKSNVYRVRLLLSYDGTHFCGWQAQSVYKNKNSIQSVLEAALTKIFKEDIHCVASGRTDSGAHAYGQNVHFNVHKDPRKIPIILALKTNLPPTITVYKAWLMPHSFSALSSAYAKTYRYYIYNSNTHSSVLYRFSHWVPFQLDIKKLQEFADLIVGRHDFKSFQSSSGRPPKTSFRRIYKARWLKPTKNLVVFEITGNGFLTQMVRNLVNCQVQLFKQGKDPEEIYKILMAKNRNLIGKSAPPCGLFLYKVFYPKTELSQAQAFS